MTFFDFRLILLDRITYSSPTDSRLGTGAVAGIVIIIFIFLIIVVCVAVYVLKRGGIENKADVEATDLAQVKSKDDAETGQGVAQEAVKEADAVKTAGTDADADAEPDTALVEADTDASPDAEVNQGGEFDSEAAC